MGFQVPWQLLQVQENPSLQTARSLRLDCRTWATWSHGTAAAGEPSLWAAGVLGLAFQVWAPAEQCRSTVGMREPNLWIAGALGPTCQHRLPGATVAASGLGEPSLQAVGVLGPDCWSGLPGTQSSGAAAGTGEPSLQAVGALGPAC
jgi:hypothetical protein